MRAVRVGIVLHSPQIKHPRLILPINLRALGKVLKYSIRDMNKYRKDVKVISCQKVNGFNLKVFNSILIPNITDKRIIRELNNYGFSFLYIPLDYNFHLENQRELSKFLTESIMDASVVSNRYMHWNV